MANVFQPRGANLAPSGSRNALTGLDQLGQSIGQGLQQRIQRRQQGQALLAQLYQQDPEIAAATVRGMGVKGLVTMGIPPEEAQQLFEQSQGTVGTQETAMGGAQESVQQPPMLRPRTAVEQQQLQKGAADIGLTQAQTRSTMADVPLKGAQEQSVLADVPLKEAQKENIEAKTATEQEMPANIRERTKLLQSEGMLTDAKTDYTAMLTEGVALTNEGQAIKNQQVIDTLLPLYINDRTQMPLSQAERAVVASNLRKGTSPPAHLKMMSEGEAAVRRMADEQGIAFQSAEDQKEAAASLEREMALVGLEAAETGIERDKALSRYYDAMTDREEAMALHLEATGGMPPDYDSTKFSTLFQKYREADQAHKSSFFGTNNGGRATLKGKFLDDVNLKEDPELYELFLRGNPSREAVRQDLEAYIISKGAEKRPGLLNSIRVDYYDANGDQKTMRGEDLVSKIANARDQDSYVKGLAAELYNMTGRQGVIDPEGRFIPPSWTGQQEQETGNPLVGALKGVKAENDARIREFEDRITRLESGE